MVLESKLQSDLPRISADPVQLQQVILIWSSTPCRQWLPSGRRAFSSEDRSRRLASRADHRGFGPGIAAESINRIFEPFFTTKPNGMGMGLSICRSIVEAHGGNLSVSPAQPQGSAFRVMLPLDKA